MKRTDKLIFDWQPYLEVILVLRAVRSNSCIHVLRHMVFGREGGGGGGWG